MLKHVAVILAAVFIVCDLHSARAQPIESPKTDTRKSAQFKKWHWYYLSDAQHDKMVATLKGIKDRQPVNVLCGDPDCRELAKDFVDAFDDAGWKVSLISSGFVGNDPGLRCSHKVTCDAITKATGIRTVQFEDAPPPGILTIMFGPKK